MGASWLGARLLVLLLLLCSAAAAYAHPMGNFSVNHYSGLTIGPNGVEVRYFIDLAEIPTYQALQEQNLDPANQAAVARYVQQRGTALAAGLKLSIEGKPVTLRPVSQAVLFPPGAGGLPTMKLGYVLRGAYPPGLDGAGASTASLVYTDTNYPGHAGWKEIVVAAPAGTLLASTAPATGRSHELSDYPANLLSTAPQDLTATVRFVLPAVAPPASEEQGSPVAATALSPAPASVKVGTKRPARALTTVPGKLAGRVPATVPGATPVAEPAAAQHHRRRPNAGNSARSSQAPSASQAQPAPTSQPAPAPQRPFSIHANRQASPPDRFAQLITVQHLSVWFLLTAALLSMGLGALHALEPGHGKTIVGAYLVGSRGTARHALLLGLVVTVAHTASVFALGAVTLYASRYILPEQLYPWLGVLSGLSIAALGGYLLLRRWSGLALDHSHGTAGQHGSWFSRTKPEPLEAPPVAQPFGATVSLTQLFTLGITGGILPCPAALVVLLSAFALHRVGLGFFLISAFSAGLALALVAFGLLMVYARKAMRGFAVDGPLTQRWLPMLSAAFMAVLGLTIAVRAFGGTHLQWQALAQPKWTTGVFVAGLGLVLGMRHSTDPDHVVAVSTIVSKQRSLSGAAVIGCVWGLGHTLTIFLVGSLIILFGVVIPPRIGLAMEFSVALMLILLGVLNLTGVMQRVVTRFTPAGMAAEEPAAKGSPAAVLASRNRLTARYGRFQVVRPLLIGLVHGLAGSAAVALLVLSTIHSPLWATLYLLIFGAGTMLGMMGMTIAMVVPILYAGKRFGHVSRYLAVASGVVSICFGCFLVYHLGYLGGLFTAHPHWTPE